MEKSVMVQRRGDKNIVDPLELNKKTSCSQAWKSVREMPNRKSQDS